MEPGQPAKPKSQAKKLGDMTTGEKTAALISYGVVVLIIVWIISAIIGQANNSSSNSNATTKPTNSQSHTTPIQTQSNQQLALSQMNTIQSGLSSIWQSCQATPSSCQALAKISALPDYQQLYNTYSANFSGTADTDFLSWKNDTGIAEGDIKQWVDNQIFGQPNPIHPDLDLQNAQVDISSFSKD